MPIGLPAGSCLRLNLTSAGRGLSRKSCQVTDFQEVFQAARAHGMIVTSLMTSCCARRLRLCSTCCRYRSSQSARPRSVHSSALVGMLSISRARLCAAAVTALGVSILTNMRRKYASSADGLVRNAAAPERPGWRWVRSCGSSPCRRRSWWPGPGTGACAGREFLRNDLRHGRADGIVNPSIVSQSAA